MKFESYALRAMFVVCMVLCFATLGSMLFTAQPNARQTIVEAQLTSSPAGAVTPLACTPDAESTPCTRMD
jgi:hypothetical protein